MLSPGTTLQGRYRVVHKLGEGGMGAVYEGTDERFGTPIALKEIIFEAVTDKQKATLAAAFEREAKSLAKARHEAIPFVRDYFSEDNCQFLVMELVEGDDLGDLLQKNNGPFPLDRAVDWMKQLLDALDYLHGLKPPIVHRDIKPQNLKVTARKRLKLLDFGIAQSSEAAISATRNTNTFIGATLNYSPIEQILRVIDPTFREFIILKHEAKAKAVLDQKTDGRADIFAVGATFYHLLTNHLPEDSTKRTLGIWEGKADPLPHPSELNPDIPEAFGDLILKAMQIDREDRFASAEEMLDSIDAAATGKSVFKPTAAQTVPLIKTVDVPVIEPTVPMASVAQQKAGVPTEPLLSSTTDEAQQETPSTDWSDIVSRPSFGGTVPNSVADLEVQNHETMPDRSSPVLSPVRRRTGMSWAIAAAVGILALGGIGGGVALMNGFLSGTQAPAANIRQNVTQPTAYRSPSASPSPTADVFVSPTPVPTPSIEVRQTETSKPKTRTQDPEKTQSPVVHRDARDPIWPNPKRKPKPAGQDPNCVYTNSCKQ